MNRRKEQRAAAIDLWKQMLERMRANEWSTFVNPEWTPSEEEKCNFRQAFIDAGWSEQECEERFEALEAYADNAPVTSEGVARSVEAILDRCSTSVLTAAKIAGIGSVDHVYFAVEPKAGPFVSTINVIMTDQSIITMGSHFTRYCGLVARAYIRTLNLNPYVTGVYFDEIEVRKNLRNNRDLMQYWWSIFSSYAFTGTHSLVPFKLSRPDEIILMEQTAYAMEIFALSHEFGHHALGHGRVLDPVGAKEEEFEADRYAAKLCEIIEERERYRWLSSINLPNPYLYTGAGGVLLLASLEIFRKVKGRVYQSLPYDTHPDFQSRSAAIKSRLVLQPYKYMTALDFCGSVENVLRCVLLELAPIMEVYPFDEVAKLNLDDWEKMAFR